MCRESGGTFPKVHGRKSLHNFVSPIILINTVLETLHPRVSNTILHVNDYDPTL